MFTRASLVRVCFVWGLVTFAVRPHGIESVLAGDSADAVAKSNELVSEALHRRIYGLEADHASLLASAVKIAPDYAPARWHAGHVNYMNRWVSVDELRQDVGLNKRLTRYEQARAKISPTVDGYLALANWCAENSLPLQERAHLFQVIDLAPNHEGARWRLGFVMVEGDWVETQTIWAGMYNAQQSQAALAKWQQPVAAIQKGLARRSEMQRQAAREKLAAIMDPEAIYALEFLAADSSEAGCLVVDAFARMQQVEASAALVRQAVFSPWPQAREDAARQLGTRPFDHYVPQLLAEMSTPIQSRIDTASTRGRVLYRHVFFREAQDQNQVLVLDTLYRRVVKLTVGAAGSGSGEGGEGGGGGGDSGPSFGEVVLADLQDTIQSREQQRMLQNAWMEAMNNRICHILRTATAQQLPSQPKAWWDWWDRQSQVTRPGEKFAAAKYDRETKTFVQPEYGEFQQESQPPAPPPRMLNHECFAAGTPVLTASGLVEIEQLKVGDLVLAKHQDTGELSLRPVLATTIRPAEQVVIIRTTGETIEATGGHPLWIDGEGWVMASEMKSGMVLHGLERGVMITDLRPGQVKQTYNLIVDGFHSYFVGFDRVLAHDNTPCRPTNSTVPGLARLAK